MRAVLPIVAIVGALAACTAKQRGPNAPQKGERWIGKVVIDGNKAFPDKVILKGLVTHKPTGLIIRRRIRLDSSLVETDSRRIEVFYHQRGYFDATVTGVQTRKLSGLRTEVRFTVREGKPSMVEAVDIAGVDADEGARLARIVGIKVGERFDYAAYNRGKTAIVSRLNEQGYAHARLTARASVDRPAHKATLSYKVNRGPLVRVGDIEVRGLQIVPESAVRNRITFKTGDRFSPKAISESRDQLRGLGRFGVVRIDFADNTRSEVSDVAVVVSEAPRRELRLGAGAAFDGGVSLDNSQWLLRGRAGYTLRGLIDALTTFDAELRPGVSVQTSDGGDQSFVGEAEVSLTRDDLWAPQLRGVAALSYDIRASDAYTSHGPGLRLGTERPLWRRRIKIGINWQVELLCFSERPNIIDPGDVDTGEYDAVLAERLGVDRSCSALDFPTASSYKLAFFEESVAIDLRDNILDTRDGLYGELRFEHAGELTGSEFTYTKLTGEGRGYLPYGKRFVLAARLRYGRALSGNLPITRRFFSGGASSQRGFGQRQLAPVAGDIETSDVEIGGEELVESSLEARLDLFPLGGSYLGLALFIDGGDVSDSSSGIELGNLHLATGVGLRYRTPIGPFRLDVAYRATRRGAGEIHASDSYAWHLSIGEAF